MKTLRTLIFALAVATAPLAVQSGCTSKPAPEVRAQPRAVMDERPASPLETARPEADRAPTPGTPEYDQKLRRLTDIDRPPEPGPGKRAVTTDCGQDDPHCARCMDAIRSRPRVPARRP